LLLNVYVEGCALFLRASHLNVLLATNATLDSYVLK
jgi:hypothetical protein